MMMIMSTENFQRREIIPGDAGRRCNWMEMGGRHSHQMKMIGDDRCGINKNTSEIRAKTCIRQKQAHVLQY